MYSVNAVLKNKKLRDGSHAVYIRLILLGGVAYTVTGIRVQKKDWDKRLGKIKSHVPLAVESNVFLENKINDIKRLLLNPDNLTKTAAVILEMGKPKSVNFFDYVDQYIAKREEANQIETAEIYQDYKNQLKKYKPTVAVSDISEAWVEGFVRFLRKTNNDATISRKLKFFRGVMDLAVKAKVVAENVFSDQQIKSSKPKIKEIPTAAEISKLIAILPQLQERQRLYIQVFLVQFFTRGTRISDVLLMKKNCIVGDSIQILEKKNKSYKSIGVHEYVRAWAEEWEDPVYLFPVLKWKWEDDKTEKENIINRNKAISSGTSLVNKALRLVSMKVGITKKLTTHCSRHGFTTMAINKLDGDLRKVQGLVNHANYKTTENYAHDLRTADYSTEEAKIYKEF
jgi:site-specific recombinase XerD